MKPAPITIARCLLCPPAPAGFYPAGARVVVSVCAEHVTRPPQLVNLPAALDVRELAERA